LLLGGAGAFLLMRRRMRSVRRLASQQLEGIAVASHEFSNAVGVLLAAGENLRDGLIDSEIAMRDQGRLITVQASRLKSLAEQVLFCARSSNHTPDDEIKEIAAADVIDDALCCLAGLLEEKHFVVERQVQRELPGIWVKLPTLSRCLQNLVTNAVKYSGSSRWVGIVAESCERSDAAGSEIRISVRDRGIGIAEEELEHIFEPFYRCAGGAVFSNSGCGLGLCIAKRDAESCGGTLSVVSKERCGAVFTIHLPLDHEITPQAVCGEKCG
jgi:signal transduction histidine kinase